jgi:[ribosomal protein S18]-alanine N-acetyltransferase
VYVIEPMAEDDIAAVSRLERRCFSNPWPSSAYRRELRNPEQNFYIVLRRQTASPNMHGNGADLSHWDSHGTPTKFSRMALFSRVRKGVVNTASGRTSRIVGFAGFWHVFDEAHVTTIAVDPDLRGRSLGELLLVSLIEEAISRRAGYLSLEVRVSNIVAIRLYEKYGFIVKGVRPKYYVDDGEDAYVMWSDNVRSADFRELLDDRRSQLERSIGAETELPDRSLIVSPQFADLDRAE